MFLVTIQNIDTKIVNLEMFYTKSLKTVYWFKYFYIFFTK